MDDRFTPFAVPPCEVEGERPFWSVMIPTYNREAYLRETVESVLAQDPGPERMQIMVVDNATTTFDVPALLREMAGDRIEYHRHPENIGGIGNINSAIALSRGRWVHVLHDDDLALTGFYAGMEEAIAAYPTATLFICPMIGIDARGVVTSMSNPNPAADGPIDDFLLRQVTQHRAPTQSLVIARDTYERIGGYAEGLKMTPDWEIAFRAAAVGGAVTLKLPLVAQRWHGGSDTSALIRGERHLIEMKATIDELARRLPPDQRAKLPVRRYAFPAEAATHYASVLTGPENAAARARNLKWAYDLDPSPRRLKWYWSSRVRSKLDAMGLGKGRS